MRLIALVACSCVLLADSLAGAAQDPERLSASDVSPAVWGVVDTPHGPGPYPGVFLLHGEADAVVPVRFAHALRDAVVGQGGEVEMHLYPGAGHAFNMPHASAYSQTAASDAFRRTVEFLRRRLDN